MADFAIFAIAVHSLSCLFVGSRLLLLAWRTGEPPELFAAMAMLGMGPFGLGLTVTSTLLVPHSLFAANLLWAFAAFALNIGSAGAFLFSVRVFYSGNTRVRAIVGCLIVALIGLWLVEAHLTAFEAAEPASLATRASDWLRSIALLWGGTESLRYWGNLRKRIALGLADPIVARRFLLWGIALIGNGITSSIDATMKLFVAQALDYPLLSLTTAFTGLMAACCLTLSFWPKSSRSTNTDSLEGQESA
jgi:hypothetical protein